MVLRTTTLTLDYEDFAKLKSKGTNMSEICRAAIKNYLDVQNNKDKVDPIAALTNEKIELIARVEQLGKENQELKNKVEKLEQRLKAKTRIIYR